MSQEFMNKAKMLPEKNVSNTTINGTKKNGECTQRITTSVSISAAISTNDVHGNHTEDSTTDSVGSEIEITTPYLHWLYKPLGSIFEYKHFSSIPTSKKFDVVRPRLPFVCTKRFEDIVKSTTTSANTNKMCSTNSVDLVGNFNTPYMCWIRGCTYIPSDMSILTKNTNHSMDVNIQGRLPYVKTKEFEDLVFKTNPIHSESGISDTSNVTSNTNSSISGDKGSTCTHPDTNTVSVGGSDSNMDSKTPTPQKYDEQLTELDQEAMKKKYGVGFELLQVKNKIYTGFRVCFNMQI